MKVKISIAGFAQPEETPAGHADIEFGESLGVHEEVLELSLGDTEQAFRELVGDIAEKINELPQIL